MNKKAVPVTIGFSALAAASGMCIIRKSDSYLSEQKDLWWMPLPLAAVCVTAAGAGKRVH